MAPNLASMRPLRPTGAGAPAAPRLLDSVRRLQRPVFAWLVVWAAACRPPLHAAEMSLDEAWRRLPRYEYGQDMAPLLAIDRAVIEAMDSRDAKAACARRLARVLADDRATLAARQYVCLQLRQVGGPEQVPLLASLLLRPETSEMARYALEAIPGEESLRALRDGLSALHGRPLVGVIHSLGARRDRGAVELLERLADAPDAEAAEAAVHALGVIGGEPATAWLLERAERRGAPTPPNLAHALLRCADSHRAAGNRRRAATIYARLADPSQGAAVRRAALDGLLRLAGDSANDLVVRWLSDADAERRRIAAARLGLLSDSQLDALLRHLGTLPADAQLAAIEAAARRRHTAAAELARSLIRADDPALQRAGVRLLAAVGDASDVGRLIHLLAGTDEVAAAAEDALARLPAADATAPLLKALRGRPAIRAAVIRVLVKRKCYEAIDPLITMARRADPAEYQPALEGLRGIADPDQADLPRLLRLLRDTPRGKHRDEVEKTIQIVCGKLPEAADPAAPVLAALGRLGEPPEPTYLPLLGRLGGPEALRRIEAALDAEDPAVRDAAVRGLCNWPNADVADRLWDLARSASNPAHRRWALRACIRVVTLPGQRSEEAALAMLREAMALAENVEDKRLAIERAAAIRTLDAVTWVARYLDDPQLAEAACEAIVELAHHRFLRQPHMDRFGPLLDKVVRITRDPELAERARRYRLGL